MFLLPQSLRCNIRKRRRRCSQLETSISETIPLAFENEDCSESDLSVREPLHKKRRIDSQCAYDVQTSNEHGAATQVEYDDASSSKVATLSNQQIAKLLVSGYVRQCISNDFFVPSDVLALCGLYYGLWRFVHSHVITQSQSQILSRILLSKLSRGSARGVALELLYRNSDARSNYEDSCDGQSNVIVLIKSNHERVFGGYTSSCIFSQKNVHGYNSDSCSFLFSIAEAARKSHVFPIKAKYRNYSTYNDPGGPVFGMRDIRVKGNRSVCQPKCYQIMDGSRLCGKRTNPKNKSYLLLRRNRFEVLDYEVYKIKLVQI